MRIKLRIKCGEKVVERVALVNSGYEADTSQLLIPVDLARELNLWPPENARELVFDTAGGPLRVWYLPEKLL